MIMKIIAILFLTTLSILSCKQEVSENSNAFAKAKTTTTSISKTTSSAYKSYGAEITDQNLLTTTEVAERYAALEEGDTTRIKFKAPVDAVCAEKGCWMRLTIANEEEVFVKFKDYGFFVPTDTDGGEAIVAGKAYLETVSVEELQHMAKDGGKSDEEIAAIVAPQRELRFMADGVLLTAK